MAQPTPVEDHILGLLQAGESIDSLELCKELSEKYPDLVRDHQGLHSVLLALSSLKLVDMENQQKVELHLSPEGELYAEEGTPEFKYGQIVAENPGKPIKEVTSMVAEKLESMYTRPLVAKAVQLAGAAMGKAKALGYIDGKGVLNAGNLLVDKVRDMLNTVKTDVASLSAQAAADLKKRGLVQQRTVNWFKIKRGENWVTSMGQVRKKVGALTEEMMKSGEWENVDFSPLNFDALGSRLPSGHEHPLLKVRYEFRQVFLQMGFEEMDTSRWVESSFWNFDSLFQGQQHPCRDMHDTFFLDRPMHGHKIEDTEYFDRVRTMHEIGGDGSIGLRYKFDDMVAQTNILRTHTTACSSRYLKEIGDEYKRTGELRPRRFFSIDRVYRNETVDATHLAEFHQVEGFVLDKNQSVGDLMRYIKEFFSRIGLEEIEFKPAYNPYTEPSMEIFAKHEGLGKWIEIGNSGVFRPEMVKPMGFPDEWSVIAWGFSLERPTMIEFKIDKITNLEGPNVSLDLVENAPIARLTF